MSQTFWLSFFSFFAHAKSNRSRAQNQKKKKLGSHCCRGKKDGWFQCKIEQEQYTDQKVKYIAG